ncbi:MAG: sensor histidine kinase [Lachnospiraceae bacterium]|nr:sensor histidine kinase [Lachnospiraceae bacterium]MDD3659632.1 sensor histidine kinase [Lachnospiraceae bacterium]
MKRLFKVKKWKIKHKLTAAMYAVLIPVILGITAYIYIQSSKTVTQELSKAYQELTRTMDDSINYIAADIEDMITYIAINDDFRFVLNSRIYSEVWNDPLVWSNETPADFVTEMLSVKNYIRCFALYTENGIRPYLNTRKNESLSSQTNDIRELEVFQKSEESLGDLCLMYMPADDRRLFTTNTSDRIVFGKTIMSYDKEKKLGYLCAAIDAKEVEAIFEADRQEKNESVYLLDKEGQIIVHSGQAESKELDFIRSGLITGKTTEGYWETDQSYIFTSENDDYQYSVFYIVPKENWTSRLKNVSKMPFVLAVVLFFAAFPIFTYVTRFINIPLQRLHSSMLNLQEGDFKQQVNVYAEDEIGDVTKVYNEMVEKIDDLIDKNYVMALREKQSELDVLQAQINPHFLYNTLDSLYWDAYNTGNLELAENIMALSELFRLALSRGEGEVSVETECNLVENYLKIQKMRFENRMDYKINLLSEMRDYKIPKLILQPFVENAIVHGLENRGNLGMIRLHGYLEQNMMIFKITDNGVGMNEEQLNNLLIAEEIQYSNQRISRYAIRNVNERLKLRYGDRFVLDIASTIGVGTTITIKIPLE